MKKQKNNKKKKSSLGRWHQNRWAQLLIFVGLFACVGFYMLWRSHANYAKIVVSSNLMVSESNGAQVITDTGANSKKGSQVVLLNGGTSTKATYAASDTSTPVETGIYDICMTANAKAGPVTGQILVSDTSKIIGAAYYLSAQTTDYTKIGCVNNVTVSSSVIRITVTNTSSSPVYISSLIMAKTSDLPGSGQLVPYRASGNTDKLPSTLKFSDEFNGTSIDQSAWSYGWVGGSNPVQSQELACYDPAQVKVTGGQLVLSAVNKDIGCTKGNHPHPYTSGNIDSHGKKTFSYGYFEAKIWLDAASNGSIANWPAWWADGTNWPTDGEMDIMEGLSGNANATWHGPLKCADGSGSAGCGYNFGRGGQKTGWHIFAANWQPGSVTAYYDGVKIGTYASSTNITAAPQFLILGLQIGPEGKYGGPIKVPSEMKVDYVRVWQ